MPEGERSGLLPVFQKLNCYLVNNYFHSIRQSNTVACFQRLFFLREFSLSNMRSTVKSSLTKILSGSTQVWSSQLFRLDPSLATLDILICKNKQINKQTFCRKKKGEKMIKQNIVNHSKGIIDQRNPVDTSGCQLSTQQLLITSHHSQNKIQIHEDPQTLYSLALA